MAPFVAEYAAAFSSRQCAENLNLTTCRRAVCPAEVLDFNKPNSFFADCRFDSGQVLTGLSFGNGKLGKLITFGLRYVKDMNDFEALDDRALCGAQDYLAGIAGCSFD